MGAVENAIFSINKLDHENGRITAFLKINKQSEIFAGHFPGQPVVPGACILHIVKDVLETALASSLLLKKAGTIKFVSMVLRRDEKIRLEISYKIENEEIKIQGKLSSGDVVCFKMQGVYILSF